MLERFEDERGTVVPAMTLPPRYQDVPAIEYLLDALPRLALRVLRTPVRIAAAEPWPGPRPYELHATVSLIGPVAVAVGLSVEAELAAAIAHHLRRRTSRPTTAQARSALGSSRRCSPGTRHGGSTPRRARSPTPPASAQRCSASCPSTASRSRSRPVTVPRCWLSRSPSRSDPGSFDAAAPLGEPAAQRVELAGRVPAPAGDRLAPRDRPRPGVNRTQGLQRVEGLVRAPSSLLRRASAADRSDDARPQIRRQVGRVVGAREPRDRFELHADARERGGMMHGHLLPFRELLGDAGHAAAGPERDAGRTAAAQADRPRPGAHHVPELGHLRQQVEVLPRRTAREPAHRGVGVGAHRDAAADRRPGPRRAARREPGDVVAHPQLVQAHRLVAVVPVVVGQRDRVRVVAREVLQIRVGVERADERRVDAARGPVRERDVEADLAGSSHAVAGPEPAIARQHVAAARQRVRAPPR